MSEVRAQPGDAWTAEHAQPLGLARHARSVYVDPMTALPEDLSQLSDDDLQDLATELQERGRELMQSGDNSDETVAEMERLASAANQVRAELGVRAEAAQERDSRRAAAADALGLSGDGEAVDSTTEPETPAETPAEEPAPGTEEETPAGAEEEEPAPAGAEDEEEEEPQPSAVAAAARRSPSALRRRQPASSRPSPAKRGEFMVATAHAPRKREGDPLDSPAAVATAIADARRNFRSVPDGVVDFVPIASGSKNLEFAVSGDGQENFSMLERIRTGRNEQGESLVAAGAFCTPQTPIYDFFRLAEAQTPVEDALPTVQAPRGGIRFITPPDFTAAAPGVGIFAHDYDSYVPDTPSNAANKPCIRVACPPMQEEFVSGVSQCLLFGNLAYRTFPEQVEAFLEDVAVAFASRKEVFYLDYIHGASTAVTGTNVPYGAFRRHVFNLTQAAVGYRKRNGMRQDAPLDVYETDVLLDVLALDILMDSHVGYDHLNDARALVTAGYRDAGLRPNWYNDSATGAGQKFNAAQAAGNLTRLPTTYQSYIHAPGTFVRLDGGSLDVGLVRDSTLNRTNDLQLFMEEWIGMAKLGIEAVRLIDVICPNGSAPDYVTPLTCP